MRKPQNVRASVDTVVDEYAETAVLTSKPGNPPSADADASAQSVYSEYVQDLERLLRSDAPKK